MPKIESDTTTNTSVQGRKWNPERQAIDYPPTRTQMTVLRDLCARTRVHILDGVPDQQG